MLQLQYSPNLSPDRVGLLAALGVLAVRGQVAEAARRVSPRVRRLGRAFKVKALGPGPGRVELPQQRGLIQGGGVRERYGE